VPLDDVQAMADRLASCCLMSIKPKYGRSDERLSSRGTRVQWQAKCYWML